MAFEIKNSVALVTGASRPNGIGAAIVEALVANGAKKVYATGRNVEDLKGLVSKYPDHVVAVRLDLTDSTAIANLPDKCPDVNLVVNNAGYLKESTSSLLQDIIQSRMEMEVNYFGPMAVVGGYAGQFLKAKRDDSSTKKATAVVNVNSIGSFINWPLGPTYCASKAAIHSLTQAQRRELQNTLVVGVYPGSTDTDMVAHVEAPKAKPSGVANAIVDALEKGVEDVFPDAQAMDLHMQWQKDSKAVERMVTGAFSGEKSQ